MIRNKQLKIQLHDVIVGKNRLELEEKVIVWKSDNGVNKFLYNTQDDAINDFSFVMNILNKLG